MKSKYEKEENLGDTEKLINYQETYKILLRKIS